MFESIPLVFLVIFSDAVLELGLRSKTRLLARAAIPVQALQQGEQELVLALSSPKDGRGLGELQCSILYKWLRGTRDDGRRTWDRQGLFATLLAVLSKKAGSSDYRRPLVSVKPRKGTGGPLHLLKDISKVNHWILSHDNLWPTDTDTSRPLPEPKTEKLLEPPGLNQSSPGTPMQPGSQSNSTSLGDLLAGAGRAAQQQPEEVPVQEPSSWPPAAGPSHLQLEQGRELCWYCLL